MASVAISFLRCSVKSAGNKSLAAGEMVTKPFSGSDETIAKHRRFNPAIDQTICGLSPLVQRPMGGKVNEIFFMCTRTISVLVTSFALAAAGFFPGPAHAQSNSARPAVLDVASKPIGKVVVATGSVTLERASAVVVQASTSGPAGQAKVGDLVYQQLVMLSTHRIASRS